VTLGLGCPYHRSSLKAIWEPLWGQRNTPALQPPSCSAAWGRWGIQTHNSGGREPGTKSRFIISQRVPIPTPCFASKPRRKPTHLARPGGRSAPLGGLAGLDPESPVARSGAAPVWEEQPDQGLFTSQLPAGCRMHHPAPPLSFVSGSKQSSEGSPSPSLVFPVGVRTQASPGLLGPC